MLVHHNFQKMNAYFKVFFVESLFFWGEFKDASSCFFFFMRFRNPHSNPIWTLLKLEGLALTYNAKRIFKEQGFRIKTKVKYSPSTWLEWKLVIHTT